MTPHEKGSILRSYEELRGRGLSSQDAILRLTARLHRSVRQIYRIIREARREALPLQGGPLWRAHQGRLCRAAKILTNLLCLPYAPTAPLPGHFAWNWEGGAGFSVRDLPPGQVEWSFHFDDEVLQTLLEEHLNAVEGWAEKFAAYRESGARLSELSRELHASLGEEVARLRAEGLDGLVPDGLVGSVCFEALSQAESGSRSGATYDVEVVGGTAGPAAYLRYGAWTLARLSGQEDSLQAWERLAKGKARIKEVASRLGSQHPIVLELHHYESLHQPMIERHAESREVATIVAQAEQVGEMGKGCQRQLRLLVERGWLPGRCEGCP